MKIVIIALIFCVSLVNGRGYGRRGAGFTFEEYRRRAKPICQTVLPDGTRNSAACPFADPDLGDDLYVCDTTYTYTSDGVSRTVCKPRSCGTDEDCRNPLDPNNESTCHTRFNGNGYCSYPENIQQYASACEVRNSNNQVVSVGECLSCFGSSNRICDTNATPTTVEVAGQTFSLYFCAEANANNNNNNPTPAPANP